MSCDFTKYNEANAASTAAAQEAKSACDQEATAKAALDDAQATYEAAQANHQTKKRAWEDAMKLENAEAAKLGIDPTPSPPA